MIGYKLFVKQLSIGIRYLQAYYGQRFTGIVGLFSDTLLEGLRAGFYQGLPGHHLQSEDALNQIGSDRGLFRYRNEPLEQWRGRVENAWTAYEQAGTWPQLKREIEYWGNLTLPSGVTITDGYDLGSNDFIIDINILDWNISPVYSDTLMWGEFIWGLEAGIEDLYTLTAICKKWKSVSSSVYLNVTTSSGNVFIQVG
jgi:hypothetical protein